MRKRLSTAELRTMVEEKAVVVVTRRGCCMTFVVRRLLQCVGADPAVRELEEAHVDDLGHHLAESGVMLQLPAVFVGGRWFGGTERVIATLVAEELRPLLKKAGALWL
ncbi:hypothetical protein SASPL_132477 [Salvia splendens]|uniref:Glutaredoxin 3 n=1 Tax=Salvia splendens TaxID=180675 RepID=A0A8X8X336_SALSN|nr:glutaredoxin-C9-like [Salvia splendens]KAG6404900.1 hypothetical protein SASPL_132477 [Salvia splendens]